MSGESEPGPARKKIKTCSTFETLHKYESSIKEAVKSLDTFMFCFVKIFKCNGDSASRFSNAWCQSLRSIEDPRSLLRLKKATFNEVFDTGFLLRLLNEPATDLNGTQRIAFKRLDLFFENIEDTNKILLEKLSEDISGAQLVGLFGTHLLKQLAVDQQMTIDSGYSNKTTFCCCRTTKCDGTLKYGDTRLGHPEVWHGSVDIMLGSVVIQIVDDIEEEVNSIMEVTNSFEHHRSQLIAESIVSGFVQKRGCVPLIAISKGKMKLYLFNPDHDLLYESMECTIFRNIMGQKTLRHSVVLMLWFALNYQFFFKPEDPSLLEDAYTSEFKTLIQKTEGVLYIYENKMRIGGCKNAIISKPEYVWTELYQ